jgi:hypothetical protein
MKMSFIISETEKSDILKVLIKYCDAAVLERDQHKIEKNYYDKLMDLMINQNEEYPIEWGEIFNCLQINYHEHRGKYEELCSTIASLDLNIEI